ncbi:MAG: nitroreductase [Gracilibacter sp. BRH_c7a]|nr:MAG: nitroreductase [Gracilibacter sp. BRH_c7a]
MSFSEIAEKRHSVRKFKDMDVEKEKILQILEAGRIAPSAVNYQPWHFIILTDRNIISKVAQVYPAKWLQNAPVIIVACGDHSQSWKRKDGKDYCDIDLAISIDHIMLAAVDLGLGTCWVCAFDAQRCHELLDLPKNLEVISLVPLGYPLEEGKPEKIRKSISEIVSWDGYTDK